MMRWLRMAFVYGTRIRLCLCSFLVIVEPVLEVVINHDAMSEQIKERARLALERCKTLQEMLKEVGY